MSVLGNDGVLIGRIRRAGLGKVKAAELLEEVAEDA